MSMYTSKFAGHEMLVPCLDRRETGCQNHQSNLQGTNHCTFIKSVDNSLARCTTTHPLPLPASTCESASNFYHILYLIHCAIFYLVRVALPPSIPCTSSVAVVAFTILYISAVDYYPIYANKSIQINVSYP